MPEPENSALTSELQFCPKHIISRNYFFPTLNSSPEIFFSIFLHSEHLFWTHGFDRILVLFFTVKSCLKKKRKKKQSVRLRLSQFPHWKIVSS